MAYATRDEVREYGVIETADVNYDAAIDDLLPRAQAIIDAWTDSAFEIADDSTKRFDAVADVDGQTLYLSGARGFEQLATITSITNGDGSSVTSGQYVTEPRNSAPYHAITLKSAYSWTYTSDSEDSIVIVGKWGYSVSVPEPIKQACITLVLHLLHGGDTRSFEDMPTDIKSILMPYRRLV